MAMPSRRSLSPEPTGGQDSLRHRRQMRCLSGYMRIYVCADTHAGNMDQRTRAPARPWRLTEERGNTRNESAPGPHLVAPPERRATNRSLCDTRMRCFVDVQRYVGGCRGYCTFASKADGSVYLDFIRHAPQIRHKAKEKCAGVVWGNRCHA